jgi:penicillin G amidase
MAHRGTNELLSLYLLNRSKNYNEYTVAIHHFECPGQNMIYADRQGNIALWGQGQFVNKWKGQGRYVMNGTDSSTLWKELIPMSENPHVINPAQGFISSANQTVTDSTYPYWYNGMFYEFRGWRINQVLNGMQQATVQDMFALQNDVYSFLAANALPVMLRNLDRQSLDDKGKQHASLLDKWDYKLTLESEAATVFQTWSSMLHKAIWDQKFNAIPAGLKPSPERTMQLLLMQDSVYKDAINISYKQTMDSLGKLKNGLQWYQVKNTSVNHLTKLPAFSYPGLKLGGWGNAVNAVKGNHGPSWRMVVQMGKEIEAYGVYPGGQSGNPYSKYYASFLNDWVEGKYYKLQFLAATESNKPSSFPYSWSVQPK